MYPGISIKLKSAIFRRNSIFNPGLRIKFLSFHKKSNSHKLESFFFWGGTGTKLFDSWPRALLQGFTVPRHAKRRWVTIGFFLGRNSDGNVSKNDIFKVGPGQKFPWVKAG